MTSLSPGVQSTLFGLLIMTACLWIGGMITVVLAARISSATLEPPARVAFFKAFGRAYGIIATIDLIVGFVVGAILLASAPWTGMSTAIVVVAVALVAALAWGIAQAIAMSRLRHRAAGTDDPAVHSQVARGGVSAAVLRSSIGLLTLALFVLCLAHWL